MNRERDLTICVQAFLNQRADEWFALAKKLDGGHDTTDLHQLRVQSRRLRVALEFFAVLFEPRPLRNVLRHLRRIMRALGNVRQCDVHLRLLRNHRAPALRQRLLAERAKHWREWQALWQRLGTVHFEEEFRALLARPRYCTVRQLRDAIRDELDRLYRKTRKRYRQSEELGRRSWHKLRLAVKHYRYGLETAAAVFGVKAQPTIESLKELQGLLGLHHDLEVLRDWLGDSPIPAVEWADEQYRRQEKRVREFLKTERHWRNQVRLKL